MILILISIFIQICCSQCPLPGQLYQCGQCTFVRLTDCNNNCPNSTIQYELDCSGNCNRKGTGLALDLCNVCGGNSSSCFDCKGFYLGTSKFDACSTCGGNGSSCPFSVESVFPSVIPNNGKSKIEIVGTGFKDPIVVFLDGKAYSSKQVSVVSYELITVQLNTSFSNQTATLSVSSNNKISKNFSLALYDPDLISISFSFQDTFSVNNIQSVLIFGTGFKQFSSALCVFDTDPIQVTTLQYVSSTLMQCDCALVPVSSLVQMKLTFALTRVLSWKNSYYIGNTPLFLKYEAESPPISSVSLSKPGNIIDVVFNSAIFSSIVSIWSSQNCSLYFSGKLWRTGIDSDCTAMFVKDTILRLKLDSAISYPEGSIIYFKTGILQGANALYSQFVSSSFIFPLPSSISYQTVFPTITTALNSCSNLIIDLSNLGNLGSRAISSANISYSTVSPDLSDRALSIYFSVLSSRLLNGKLVLNVPWEILSAREYIIFLNVSNTYSIMSSNFSFSKFSRSNFPVVALQQYPAYIDFSITNVFYVNTQAPCNSISSATLNHLITLSTNTAVIQTYNSSNIIIPSFTLKSNQQYKLLISSWYTGFAPISNQYKLNTISEHIWISFGAEEYLIGIATGIKFGASVFSNIQVVTSDLYDIVWYCFLTTYAPCIDLSSTNNSILQFEKSLNLKLDNKLPKGSYNFYLYVINKATNVSAVSDQCISFFKYSSCIFERRIGSCN